MNINKQDIEKALQAASARWGNWVKYVIAAIIGAAQPVASPSPDAGIP